MKFEYVLAGMLVIGVCLLVSMPWWGKNHENPAKSNFNIKQECNLWKNWKIMSKRTNTYPEVLELPANARSIENYAKEVLDSKPPYVYKLHKEGKLQAKGVQIVVYQGYNFIINLKNVESL